MKSIMSKKILILGNGFDLAHGLPTKYSDFLGFAEWAMKIYTYADQPGAEMEYADSLFFKWSVSNSATPAHNFLREKLTALFKSRVVNVKPVSGNLLTNVTSFSVNDRLDLFHDYLEKNIWYEYIKALYVKEKTRGENWIDFESEISYIIEILDNIHTSLTDTLYDAQERCKSYEYKVVSSIEKTEMFFQICTNIFNDNVSGTGFNKNLSLRSFRKKLYDDLERLILAFEIYLTDFVEDIPIKEKLSVIDDFSPDFVISFNYTKIYEKHYMRQNSNTEICHIHGVCDKNRKPEENNMVLGIDEYLAVDKRSENVDFCIFKKFVQRIRKHNDVAYAVWSNYVEKAKAGELIAVRTDGDKQIYKVDDGISDIYVYGHSLDVTDKDILKRFLISNRTRIYICARDKASEGELIANLIRITDEETIIRKSTTNPPMIQFIVLS